MKRELFSKLVYGRKIRVSGRIPNYWMNLLGGEIPLKVWVGDNLQLAYAGCGVVRHPATSIGRVIKVDNVLRQSTEANDHFASAPARHAGRGYGE